MGARFDGEVDAFLILVLSVYVARSAGAWVLAIGAARYAFLAAGWLLPWMREPLPPRYWRKVVAATQGIVLTIAAADVLPLALTQAALVVALALLAESFGRDVWWLWSRRHAHAPSRRRDVCEHSIAAVLTILAVLLVWAALVAPDQPSRLTPSAFVRVPLEGLVVIALALVLPATARRLLAWIVGPALGLLVIVKILDFGFFATFDRPFDPVGDWSYTGIGIETLRDSIGGTAREPGRRRRGGALRRRLRPHDPGGASPDPGRGRPPPLVAPGRHGARRRLGALLGVRCAARLRRAHRLRERRRPGRRRGTCGAGRPRGQRDLRRRDQATTASATPLADQLLTGLRGKDVILAFVESYGRVAVQGSSFSPRVDAALDKGTRRLQAAGFSSRSAFLTSSTFGGASWLAHSTMHSGLWVNSQRRYYQLVKTDRFTLSRAFKRAGWRTVDDVPSNNREWPQGSSFYRYDKVYDRRNVGYRGPRFAYASMPDQYVLAALQRLELAKPDRRPVFAEVDLVSSHAPWTRIPQLIDWSDVGDGSVFNRIPVDQATKAELWSDSERVRAAYGRSIEYTLNALFSFVQHYGDDDLVLVVLGDHQPWTIVSGQDPSHDVPISVIAHDPAVLDQIAGWGWEDGMRPGPQAPVWPMNAFRDRFLSAFGSQPATR